MHVFSSLPRSTSAANVGIDNELAKYVLQLGWPRDLCTYFQQRGRAGRVAAMQAVCILLGSVSSFLTVMFQIHKSTNTSSVVIHRL